MLRLYVPQVRERGGIHGEDGWRGEQRTTWLTVGLVAVGWRCGGEARP